jgi:hypothetical protein|tara:strand:+ start:281 stop:637 length:357 start_codon:yes stop_codon:yes gene_type:complete
MSKYIANRFDGDRAERFAIDAEIIYALCRAGFSDTSWGDDVCPSFSRWLFNDPCPELDIEFKPIGRLQVFVDAENVEHREFTDTHRFQVHHYNLDGVLFSYQGFHLLIDALKYIADEF